MRRAWKNAHRAGRTTLSKRDFKLGRYKGSSRRKSRTKYTTKRRRSRKSGRSSGQIHVPIGKQKTPTSLSPAIVNPSGIQMNSMDYLAKQNSELSALKGKSTEEIEKAVRDRQIDNTISRNKIAMAAQAGRLLVAEQQKKDFEAALQQGKATFNALTDAEKQQLSIYAPGIVSGALKSNFAHGTGLGHFDSNALPAGAASTLFGPSLLNPLAPSSSTFSTTTTTTTGTGGGPQGTGNVKKTPTGNQFALI